MILFVFAIIFKISSSEQSKASIMSYFLKDLMISFWVHCNPWHFYPLTHFKNAKSFHLPRICNFMLNPITHLFIPFFIYKCFERFINKTSNGILLCNQRIQVLIICYFFNLFISKYKSIQLLLYSKQLPLPFLITMIPNLSHNHF